MTDPYQILGVGRFATQKEIQSAYRALAKKFHPDLNPGDASAEEKFKAISGAYDIVGHDENRKRYDSSAIGDLKSQRARDDDHQDHRSAPAASSETDLSRFTDSADFGDFQDADGIFSRFFSGVKQRSSS